MKKIYGSILMVVLLCSTQLSAQESKMNIALYKYINRIASRSTETIPVLVKGNIAKIRSYTISHGGVFKYAVANKYASIVLPVSSISDFANSSFVLRVEGISHKSRPMGTANSPMDSVACHQSQVFPVHNDSTPLTRSYLGDSVVLGIIDGGGFYFQHKDFRQQYDTTKTRFLYIWDQTVNGTPPSGYNFGTEWDSAKINAGQCTETDNLGHGTNCLGNAAGNGQAFGPSKAYVGAAPDANIIAVKFNGASENWLTNVVDAANYIYSKADAISEPCVISLSDGEYTGSHDGQDLATQMLDSLITEHAGHAFVTACGDGGGYNPFHLGYTATSDSLFTWFAPTANYVEAFEFWIDTNQASNFNFAIGADNPTGWKALGRDRFLNIGDFDLKKGLNGYAGGLENSKGKIIFLDTVVVEQVANAYHFVCYIGTDSIYYFYRFITKGSGHFDLWSDDSLTGTWQMGSHAFQSYLPTVNEFNDFARYVYPDSLQSICSGFQCSPNVISVANYTNRDSWPECSGGTYTSSGETPGNLSASSSWGPTRDGRIEPDISAPGDESICAASAGTISGIGTSSFKVAKGCVYDRNGGTSLAAPFVAGVAALYLQKFPYASWKNVKAAIDSCAIKDNFTGVKPISYEWGYGKVNAYCIMLDTPTGVNQPIASNNIELKNYPNPFTGLTNFVYNTGTTNFQLAEIDVFNMIGQKVTTLPLHSSSGSLQFNNNSLPGGMYIYRLVVDQKTLATGKFTIVN